VSARLCTDILLQGFRYPLPAVSKRAAEDAVSQGKAKVKVASGELAEGIWSGMGDLNRFVNVNNGAGNSKGSIPRVSQNYVNRAVVAALTHILMPESEHLRTAAARATDARP
jgi:hypothetical protein